MRKSIIVFGLLLSGLVFAQDKPAPSTLGITDLQAGADAMLPVKSEPNEYMDVFRIGRLDMHGVFHGTMYNTRNYATREQCSDAFLDTVDVVRKKAVKAGASDEQAQSMAERFNNLYDCHELHLDPNVVENNPGVETKPQAPEPQTQPSIPVQVVPTQPMLPPTMPPANMVYPDMTKLTIAPPMPTRPYYMAEMVSLPGSPLHWVNYATAYASPAQCWGAVNAFIAERQEEIQKTFVQMSQTYNASEWYLTQMRSLIERRKRLSCVITGS